MSEETEITFHDLLANVVLNEEIIITISEGDVERTKTGIKNAKADQTAKLKVDGLPVDNSTLSFITFPNKELEGMIDLKIILARKGTVKIKKLRVPDGEF